MSLHLRAIAPAIRLAPLAKAVGITVCAFGSQAFAQGAADGTRLADVVVTASGFEQEIRQAPASISVITREELQQKQFRDLGEALQGIEGIDVRSSTGKTGGMDISIRGMPSDYTLVLIDGRRQNVAGNVTPNGFDHALTSFIPPLSAIERIEVIRGPMSTLYGSDAMGGVINIITRRVAREWGGALGLEAGLPESGKYGTEQKVNLYANGPLVDDLLGLAVRGSVYRRAESDLVLTPDGVSAGARNPAPAESRQHSLGARLTLTPTADHDLWLDIEQGRTWYDNEECRLGTRDYLNCTTGATTTTASGYRDYLRFNRDQVAIGHTARLDLGMIESSLMRTKTETIGRTIPTASRPAGDPSIGTDRKLETINTVFDTKLIAPIGTAHVATIGAQWWEAKLEDSLLPDRHYRQRMWSVFGEDEWQLTDSLTATLGLRHDRHEAFGGHTSPRAYLVWSASEQWTLKGGISRGFRAPRLDQLIDGVSGISGQGVNINIGNPDLKPEVSTSRELALLFDGGRGLSGSATLFHNRIKDKIGSGGDCTVDFISSCAANPSATYSINNDEAKTWGFELTTRVPLAAGWDLSLNYTWTDSEVVEAGSKNGKLSDTARHMANAQLRWQASEKTSLWLRGEYRGKSRRFNGDPKNFTGNTQLEYEALGDLKAYTLFSLGGSHRVSEALTLNARVLNLLDKDFREFKRWTNLAGDEVWGSAYFKTSAAIKGMSPAGRTYWISANMSF